jgi:hypothetical protein
VNLGLKINEDRGTLASDDVVENGRDLGHDTIVQKGTLALRRIVDASRILTQHIEVGGLLDAN